MHRGCSTKAVLGTVLSTRISTLQFACVTVKRASTCAPAAAQRLQQAADERPRQVSAARLRRHRLGGPLGGGSALLRLLPGMILHQTSRPQGM